MPQACAVEIHTDILQEPFFARIWQEKLHSKNCTLFCVCAIENGHGHLTRTVWIRTNAGEQKACNWWVERAWFPFSFLHTCSCWFRVVRRVTAKLYVLQPWFWNLMFPEKKLWRLSRSWGYQIAWVASWWVQMIELGILDDECTHWCTTPSGIDNFFSVQRQMALARWFIKPERQLHCANSPN